MKSRRRHRSSAPSLREYLPPEGSPGGNVSRGRRRRSRYSRRLKSRLGALAAGFMLAAAIGGSLGWLAIEFMDSPTVETTADNLIPQAPAPTPVLAPAPAPAANATEVPVVTCPAKGKLSHPAIATACGDLALLKALLAQPGAASTPDPRTELAGRTPLHHAAQLGDTRILAVLLAAGADPNQADGRGDTPLHLVAINPRLRNPEFVARRLIDAGARLDLRNTRNRTPIQELEADHARILNHQNLAKVLFQAEREELLTQWLTPTVPTGEKPLTLPSPPPPAEESVVIDTGEGRIRIPVDAPAAGAER
jgi:hypothetical protein